MRPVPPDSSDSTDPPHPPAPLAKVEQWEEQVQRHESRNFLVLAAYQVLIRTGWIFKTESIVIPAVLDLLGGQAWLRGCLPLLNRFGQGVPPLLMARRVKVMPRKKWATVTTTLLMALVFLLLAGLWLAGRWWALDLTDTSWMSPVFLILYGLFFSANGINQLCVTTVQGKLIRANRRGRMMLVANVVGAASAIACAWWLMPRWLRPADGDFDALFGFTALCFALAAAAMVLLSEPQDHYHQPATGLASIFRAAGSTLKRDANFRRLALIAALFSTSMMLFPHYQALGQHDRIGLDLSHLMWWAIVQNAGTALFSLIAGPVADRHGNRLVLRSLMLGICSAPVATIALSYAGQPGRDLFFLVFVLVGMTPVAIRVLNNYTLEISPPADHTRYLGTLSLCLAVPIVLSPLVGLLIDRVGFDPVFLSIAGLLLVGWTLSFSLLEPRQAGRQ